MGDEPAQTDEVVAQVSGAGECAVVHQGTGVEVLLFHERANEREPYAIVTRFCEIPQSPQLAKALELGFALRRSVDGTAYELERRCFGIRAAAQSALMLARLLTGSGADEKLWLTSVEPDCRDAPRVAPSSERPPPAHNPPMHRTGPAA